VGAWRPELRRITSAPVCGSFKGIVQIAVFRIHSICATRATAYACKSGLHRAVRLPNKACFQPRYLAAVSRLNSTRSGRASSIQSCSAANQQSAGLLRRKAGAATFSTIKWFVLADANGRRRIVIGRGHKSRLRRRVQQCVAMAVRSLRPGALNTVRRRDHMRNKSPLRLDKRRGAAAARPRSLPASIFRAGSPHECARISSVPANFACISVSRSCRGEACARGRLAMGQRHDVHARPDLHGFPAASFWPARLCGLGGPIAGQRTCPPKTDRPQRTHLTTIAQQRAT